MRRALAFALVAVTAALAVTGAHAQTPRRIRTAVVYVRPPNIRQIEVNKRSFLDPGPVVPVGSAQRYMFTQTIYNITPDAEARTSIFGNMRLPGPFDIPGGFQRW